MPTIGLSTILVTMTTIEIYKSIEYSIVFAQSLFDYVLCSHFAFAEAMNILLL